jgi:seryl-tRNA synthetase
MGAVIGSKVRFVEDPEGEWRVVKTDEELDCEHLLPWIVEGQKAHYSRAEVDALNSQLAEALSREKWAEALLETADEMRATHNVLQNALEKRRKIKKKAEADARQAMPSVVALQSQLAEAREALKAADTYIDKGHYEMARNITRATIAKIGGGE